MLVTIALIYQAHRIKKKIKISTKYTNKYLNLVILILVNLKKKIAEIGQNYIPEKMNSYMVLVRI